MMHQPSSVEPESQGTGSGAEGGTCSGDGLARRRLTRSLWSRDGQTGICWESILQQRDIEDSGIVTPGEIKTPSGRARVSKPVICSRLYID